MSPPEIDIDELLGPDVPRELPGCSCPDWAVQIEKVNGPILMQTLRSGHTWRYDGKMFAYCPWCGSALPTSGDV